MAFIQSEMISIGFYKKYIDGVLPVYNQFISKNAYPQFDDKAIAAFQKAMKTAAGTPAPDFALQDGRRLSSLRGKVVMVNFWATWCRPCLKKMEELKPVQNNLGDQIEFVHIAFDKDQKTWEQFIQKKDYKGIHLLAPASVHSAIAKQYDVKALPQYFIIDKNGNFAEKPPVFTTKNIEAALSYLNRR